ncbi:FliM/FliN family flagellar motor switch protein [Holosporaceae bacterium 'Namur']|nr:FliM/FliN family flagellar motor switch protein [Holosporaceae bacterium 'Namur']
MAHDQSITQETEKNSSNKTWEQALNEKSQSLNREGVNQPASNSHKAKGVELLLDKILQTSIRLPMLEITFDRFVRINSTSLRNYTADNVDVEIESMKTERFGDCLSRIGAPSMFSVFKVIEWDNFCILAFDSTMIYAFVEVLFGGRKTPPSLKVEGRPFTSIENSVVKSITEIVLHDLSLAFNPVTSANFQLDRVETNPKFAMIVRPEDVAIVLNLKITMDTRSGNIHIILPYTTIEPVKKILSKPYIGERGSKDPNWTRHFENEIGKATVTIKVSLDGMPAGLKNVAELKVGKTIMLDKMVGADWDIKLNETIISAGQPGKSGDKLAIQLNDSINLERYKK